MQHLLQSFWWSDSIKNVVWRMTIKLKFGPSLPQKVWSHIARPKKRRTNAHFKLPFARTLCECTRTCANLISQLSLAIWNWTYVAAVVSATVLSRLMETFLGAAAILGFESWSSRTISSSSSPSRSLASSNKSVSLFGSF